MYWGKLQKNAKTTEFAFSWVAYFIRTYFPFWEGGGVCSITGRMNSLNFEVGTVRFMFSKTFSTLSTALKIRCLFNTEMKWIGKSTKGAVLKRMLSSICLMVLVSLFSTRSHLLISK